MPSGSEFSFGYSAPDALPGWRLFGGTNEILTVGYNSISQNGLAEFLLGLSLISGDAAFPPTNPLLVEGRRGFCFYCNFIFPESYSLAQRGLIPPDAKFMQFRLVGNVIPYIEGVRILVNPLGDDDFTRQLGPQDDRYPLYLAMVDVSQYAGKEVELRFASLFADHSYQFYNAFYIDSIKFVGEPLWIDPTKLRFTSEGISFTWIGSLGSKFQVEARTNLSSAWQSLGLPVISTNGVYSFTDKTAVEANTPPQRFYRVKVVPQPGHDQMRF